MLLYELTAPDSLDAHCHIKVIFLILLGFHLKTFLFSAANRAGPVIG
jgi:hypothetical protein